MNSLSIILVLGTSVILSMGAPLRAQDFVREVSYRDTCRVAKDEIQVYIDFFKSRRDSKNVAALVTRTEGRDYGVDDLNLQLAVQGHGVPTEVRADFKTKNNSRCVIEPFTGDQNLRFISKREADTVFACGWREFYRKYGKGAWIVNVSRVGLNRDRNLALLHIMDSGEGVGVGELYVLERKDGVWAVKSSIQTLVGEGNPCKR